MKKRIVQLILFVLLVAVVAMGARKMAPHVNTSDCVGCTDCIKICPVNSGKKGDVAIEMVNGHAIINPETCISCGLCVSVCSFSAVRY